MLLASPPSHQGIINKGTYRVRRIDKDEIYCKLSLIFPQVHQR